MILSLLFAVTFMCFIVWLQVMLVKFFLRLTRFHSYRYKDQCNRIFYAVMLFVALPCSCGFVLALNSDIGSPLLNLFSHIVSIVTAVFFTGGLVYRDEFSPRFKRITVEINGVLFQTDNVEGHPLTEEELAVLSEGKELNSKSVFNS
ncbi:membrane hypothetical protein [Vibrio chagasii]|nr:membrane hypothetical protein [Vibrio chagasii]